MMAMESDVVGGEARSAFLVSGGTGTWTDHTVVELHWTFYFLGGSAGLYKAAPVKIAVYPPRAGVTAVTAEIVERRPGSGRITKQERLALAAHGTSFEAEIEWTSTVDNPEQEFSVTLTTDAADEPDMLLADPISRRRNFLIALGR